MLRYNSRVTELEQQILQALDELAAAVQSIRGTGAKPDLQPLFARLDSLATRLNEPAQGRLKHFLESKSYEKARAFLRAVKPA